MSHNIFRWMFLWPRHAFINIRRIVFMGKISNFPLQMEDLYLERLEILTDSPFNTQGLRDIAFKN